MPRRARVYYENSSSNSDDDPDFVVPRNSSHRFASSTSTTNFHGVRRSSRRTRYRVRQAPMNAEIENEIRLSGRGRQNVSKPREDSTKVRNGKCTILSWLINSGTIEEGTRVYRDGEVRLEGKISREGILCSCCNSTITVKEFECHAGSSKDKAYMNTYTGGRGTRKSLLQCQIEAWNKQKTPASSGFQTVDVQKDDVDKNDDICNICGGDGQLICCDVCPLTYHEECVGIKTLPQAPFHCPICVCSICGMYGAKPFSFRCFQCEEFYHWNCLGGAAIPAGNVAFCGKKCREVYIQLQKLLGVPHQIGNGFLWTLNKHMGPESVSHHGEEKRMDCNSKIALAYAVYDECFQPIIDSRTGLDRIPTVVFNCGSNLSRLDCRGFYTFTLERKDEVTAAASIRVHGTKLAEMPFIGTREKYRREGMCQQLVDAIVSVLLSLKVKKLVLPSAPERLDYWTTHYEFKHITEIQRREMLSMNLMVFKDTTILQKILSLDDGSMEGKKEVLNGDYEPKCNNSEDSPKDKEDKSPKPLLFDLNLEPPNEEVKMCKNDEEKKPSLGIFLALKDDGSLNLKKCFVDGPPKYYPLKIF
ncbi:increased DNA methylation 1-like isoform X2 [Macadamia integrifolia]|uniref:increased DNA methylation 1-like isoform X2 n=1 Tax=Macadamia integrifolia TaxID=60698 RepID=UPI001C4EB77D|nr:increased DNA methylation 1-like isoform X2 [Macadamia integrifolia]